MSQSARVVWSEGLFLRPEHFQQAERFQDRQRDLARAELHSNAWGLGHFELESDLLRIGKLALKSASGVLPDGYAFAMPEHDPLPPPLEIDSEVRDQTVYLGLPLAAATAVEFGRDADDRQLHRYDVLASDVRDNTGTSQDTAVLEVGHLRARFLLESEPRDSYACIPVARIIEVAADKSIKLDEQFIATVVHARAAPPLRLFLSELRGMLNQRGEALAARVSGGGGRGGASEIADFLMLQVINRVLPQVAHYTTASRFHPEEMFVQLAGLAGELATFNAPDKRPPQLPEYTHENLTPCFDPLFAALRQALSSVLEQTAIPIPVKEKNYGVRVALVNDKSLFDSASFVLAVHADMPTEQLIQALHAQAKIGPVEKIRDLVNLQLPGIDLKQLPAAPRQIPYHAGYVYLEFNRQAKLWSELPNSGGIAMYFAGGLAGLKLELWAIRR